MDIRLMKEYISDNNYVPFILENLGYHQYKDKGEYITCGNSDGDNTNAVTVYHNANLTVGAVTRKPRRASIL